jgi:hypothetical protein
MARMKGHAKTQFNPHRRDRGNVRLGTIPGDEQSGRIPLWDTETGEPLNRAARRLTAKGKGPQ